MKSRSSPLSPPSGPAPQARQERPESPWRQVEMQATWALAEYPREAAELVEEFADPEDPFPLGTLLYQARQLARPPKLWEVYLAEGGPPDPEKAPPLAVLKGFLGLFQMWLPNLEDTFDPISGTSEVERKQQYLKEKGLLRPLSSEANVPDSFDLAYLRRLQEREDRAQDPLMKQALREERERYQNLLNRRSQG